MWVLLASHENKKPLLISTLVNDYNKYIGGVDIADQLRSNYPCHQRSRRNWLPLWFWILDTTIINMYIITGLTNPKKVHKVFQCNLSLEIVTSTASQLHPCDSSRKPDPRAYITCKTFLPLFSFRTTGHHRQIFQENKKQYWYYRYKKTYGNLKKSSFGKKSGINTMANKG